MNGSGKAEIRQISLAALPSISTTSFRGSSTRGGPSRAAPSGTYPRAQLSDTVLAARSLVHPSSSPARPLGPLDLFKQGRVCKEVSDP
uniref:Uncharacterized protein n=1 Tax=Sus scrofa TaxID=9823 RepID=A0A8W4FFN7_PIG